MRIDNRKEGHDMGNLNFINKNLIAGSIACALLMGGSPVPSAEGQSVQNKDQKAKNEEQRQKNIKQLNEYYAAEKKHMEQQDRYAAEWAKKTPEERKKGSSTKSGSGEVKPVILPPVR